MLAKNINISNKNPSIFLGALCLIGTLFIYSPAKQALAAVKNGFNLTDSLVPHSQIFQGGPPRDGIPSIDRPKFTTAQKADYLQPGDRVIGVVVEGQARAYPINILNWHEIVNDRIGGVSFVVTYCPLCGTGMVFSSRINQDNSLVFGVSGLLYNSDVLLYDRQTESLWSQVMGQAVAGPNKGKKLQQIPARHTTWKSWLKRHPRTKVLTRDTGEYRDYDRNPYLGYETSDSTLFPVTNDAPNDYHPKERVLGISINGVFKAYPFVELYKKGKHRLQDTVGGSKLEIHWDAGSSSGWVTDGNGKEHPSVIAFWFAWYAFHPKTLVFKAL